RARGDRGAARLAVRHARLHRADHDREAALQELGPVHRGAADDAGRPRPLLRHLLLPTRLPVLEAATGPQAAAPGLGSAVRLRAPDRRRPRARGLRPPPDDRLAPCDAPEADRPRLLA